MSVNQDIVNFILDLLGDPEKAEQFDDNPGKCLTESGLTDVTPTEVVNALPTVVEQVSPGGTWSPPAPSGGNPSPSEIIHQVVNNYYTTVIGDNNTVVQAIGDGAVAVGGNNEGNISTGGGVTGDGNEVGNTTTNQTTTEDNSIHGDNSGNATKTANVDNSSNDNHAQTNVTAGSGGPAAPTAPTASPGLHPNAATMPHSVVNSAAPPATTPLSATTPMSASTPLDAAVITTTVAASANPDAPLTDPAPLTQLVSDDWTPTKSPFDDTPADDIPTVPSNDTDPIDPRVTTTATDLGDDTTIGQHTPTEDALSGESDTPIDMSNVVEVPGDGTDVMTGDDITTDDAALPVVSEPEVDTGTVDTYAPDVSTPVAEPQGIVAPESGDIPDGVYY